MSNASAKYIFQAIAIAIGLLGASWLYMAIVFALSGIRDNDPFSMLFMVPLFVVVGLVTVRIAYNCIRHFSSRSIRHLVGLVCILVYLWAIPQAMPPRISPGDGHDSLTTAFGTLCLMGLAYLLYRLMSVHLIRVTKAEDI